MRRIALALLVAATGCNWVYGLQHTRLVDAAPDTPDGAPPPPPVVIQFDYAFGTTDASGAPLAAKLVPISPAPVVMAGPIDGGMTPAPYDTSDMTKSGLDLSFMLAGQPWRLAYTVDYDPVPYEVQWSVKSAHLVLPWLRRDGDTAPPAGSSYQITPTPTTTLGAPILVTSGAFTYTQVPNADRVMSSTEVDFHFPSEARAVLGPLGTPKGSLGDWVLLADTQFYSGPNPALYNLKGFALVKNAELMAGTPTTVTPTWTTTGTTYTNLDFQTLATNNRMNSISGLGGACCNYRVDEGVLYNPNILPFVPDRSPTPGGLDVPLIASFAHVTASSPAVPASLMTAEPTAPVILLPHVFYARESRPRTAYGVTLESALTVICPVATTNFPFTAPLASGVTFNTMTLMTGSADAQVVPKSSSTMMLTWLPESGALLQADDFVVTLYEIANNILTPLRRYQVTSPAVGVDPTLFVAGHHYVFGITSRHGFPNIANADYSAVTLPFAETTTFPLAFTVN